MPGRALRLSACVLLINAIAARAGGPATGPVIGVSGQPCLGVPVQPTAAHTASADPYQS